MFCVVIDDELMAESFNMWMKKVNNYLIIFIESLNMFSFCMYNLLQYEKTYSTVEEYNERLRVYTSNYYYIEQLNEEHGPHTECM